MGDTIKDGGEAFPHNPYEGPCGGMSLRDWFAGQALAGTTQKFTPIATGLIAQQAYKIADAMLKARETKP